MPFLPHHLSARKNGLTAVFLPGKNCYVALFPPRKSDYVVSFPPFHSQTAPTENQLDSIPTLFYIPVMFIADLSGNHLQYLRLY